MNQRSAKRYRHLLSFSRASLIWETLWPRLWPVAVILGVFLSLALLDVLPLLPGWLHALILVLFAASALCVVAAAFKRLIPVDHHMARRHLEQSSALVHRPLTAMEDQHAAGIDDPVSRALWRRHLARAQSAAKKLSLSLPAPDMARREPWGIRAGVILLLGIAIAAAGRDAPNRLLNAVTPGLVREARPPLAELWITPPAYTGQPPIFLTNRQGAGHAATGDGEPRNGNDSKAIIEVPQDSAVLVRTAHTNTAPTFIVGARELELSRVSSDAEGSQPTFSAETNIEQGTRLAVETNWNSIAEWGLRVIPDRPPTVAFAGPPQSEAGGLLSLPFDADDDYAVLEVTAIIRLRDGSNAAEHENAQDGTEIRLPMPRTTSDARSFDGTQQIDLTPHPWAGQSVSIVFEALDALGQIGTSDTVETVLPERIFNHPVARAIIAERKKLLHPSEATRNAVSAALARIAETPAHFAGDVVVSLSLSVVRSRLIHDRSQNAILSSRDILWNTALRLEEGDVPFAERALQDARQALWEALRQNAPMEEIERLTDALQRALDDYMAAVTAELARRGDLQDLSEVTVDLLQTTNPQEIIDLMREFARAGARDSARQLLAELQRMLEGIRAGLAMDETRKDVIAANALAKSLRALAGEQQQLLDDTFQRLRSGPSSSPPPQPKSGAQASTENTDGAAEQQRLRGALGDIMLRADQVIGNIPGPLGTADRAMKDAIEAFQETRARDAIANQTTAVEALNRAIEGVNQVLAQRLSRLLGVTGSNPEEFEDGPAGPFGRSGVDGMGGFGRGNIEIPDKGRLTRARQIIDELRRKAGEQNRTRIELDYIDRLLRQF